MSFIAIPSGKDGQPLHRKTPHSAIHETEEAAREWAEKYIEDRKTLVAKAKNPRKAKKLSSGFARLHKVVIYEDQGAIYVNPVAE